MLRPFSVGDKRVINSEMRARGIAELYINVEVTGGLVEVVVRLDRAVRFALVRGPPGAVLPGSVGIGRLLVSDVVAWN